jgi:hypothetical protein
VSSLTSAGPLPSISRNAAAPPETGTVILQVVAARAVNELNSPLLETLLAATGPGKVIAGTVDATAPDGTVTILTRNGTLVTLHHPPELPLTIGSSVVLRIVSTLPVPQAALLAINGRPFVARGTSTPGQTLPSPVAAPPTAPRSAGSGSPSTSAASFAASFVATISFEDETAIEAALSGNELKLGSATAKDPTSQSTGPSVVATLVRPAPAKLGQAPVPVGTRYLVTLSDVGDIGRTSSATSAQDAPSASTEPSPAEPPLNVTEAPNTTPTPLRTGTPAAGPTTANETPAVGPEELGSLPNSPLAAASIPQAQIDGTPAQAETGAGTHSAGAIAAPETPTVTPEAPRSSPTSPLAAASAPQARVAAAPVSTGDAASATPPADASAAFHPQISILAGRVVPQRAGDETLVETAIGTLSLTLPDKLPPGTAVQLRISAVAPPVPRDVIAPSVASPADPSRAVVQPALIEEITSTLAAVSANFPPDLRTALVLEPGAQLAAVIFSFLAGVRQGMPPRNTDTPMRKALIAAGRTDLATRLDAASHSIGTVQSQQGPDGWGVTVLPFLGQASVQPMKLYRKQAQDRDDESKGKGAQRFVLEVELKRLGPLQFDGLVRERRFDLVLRTRQALELELQELIQQVFHNGMSISGWTGDIGFGKAGRFPLVPLADDHPPLDLGA